MQYYDRNYSKERHDITLDAKHRKDQSVFKYFEISEIEGYKKIVKIEAHHYPDQE